MPSTPATAATPAAAASRPNGTARPRAAAPTGGLWPALPAGAVLQLHLRDGAGPTATSSRSKTGAAWRGQRAARLGPSTGSLPARSELACSCGTTASASASSTPWLAASAPPRATTRCARPNRRLRSDFGGAGTLAAQRGWAAGGRGALPGPQPDRGRQPAAAAPACCHPNSPLIAGPWAHGSLLQRRPGLPQQ